MATIACGGGIEELGKLSRLQLFGQQFFAAVDDVVRLGARLLRRLYPQK